MELATKEHLQTISEQEIKQKYIQVRQHTEELCKPLQTEDYVVQPVDFISPPKWNLAHVSWFFETFVLKKFHKGYKEFHEKYGYFFNSYYNNVGKRVLRMNRGNMTRPTTEEVYQYRACIDEQMQEFMACTDLSEEMLAVIELGLNHEQQHQELLLTDLKYILAHNPLFPAYTSISYNNIEASFFEQKYLEVAEGLYSIGYAGNEFYFDNEKGVHQVYLHSFKIADRLTTNGEYLEFVKAGGYRHFQYWLDAGWSWVQQNTIESPLYWHLIEEEWHTYTLRGLQKVNLQEPVTHISLYEADAFARWKGKRLPTEFEWEAACGKYHEHIPKEANLLESMNFHPNPVSGHTQLYGDAWEWTNSAYLPYPYYNPSKGALGEYNGKFMMNQMVLRGGSCVTPRNHIRRTYRNFFHPHERWQFTGLRLAEYI